MSLCNASMAADPLRERRYRRLIGRLLNSPGPFVLNKGSWKGKKLRVKKA